MQLKGALVPLHRVQERKGDALNARTTNIRVLRLICQSLTSEMSDVQVVLNSHFDRELAVAVTAMGPATAQAPFYAKIEIATSNLYTD